jgi:TonB family protein
VLAIAVLAAPARAAAQGFDQPLPPPPERTPPPAAPKLTRAPSIKKNVEPAYPPDAFAAGVSADVTMMLSLDAAGRVTKVVVTRAAGQGFDEAAAAAAAAMEFEPAEVDGKPSAIRIEYTVHFQPKAVPTSPPPSAPPPPPPAAPARLVLRLRVQEKGTRHPVAGADVAVTRLADVPTGAAAPAGTGAATGGRGGEPRAEIVGATDEDGRFDLLADVPAGGLRVVAGDSLHEPCIRTFTAAELAGAVPAAWTCFAPARSGGVYETHVHADARHPEETKTTLGPAELTTVPGTLGDPLRVIQNLPGVARAPYGLGLLIVRGASPADTGVFIDGQSVPQLYHFLVGPSVLSASLIEKIDFFPGGFGARYGRFSGGLVDVETRSDVGRQLHGAADISLFDSSVFFEGPLPNGVRVSAAVRRSYIDAWLPLLIPKQSGSTFVTAVPVYWDYQARVEKDLRGGGRLTLEAFGNDDDLQIVAQDPAQRIDSNNHLGSHRVVLAWLTDLHGWVSRFAPAYGYGVQAFTAGPLQGSLSYHRFFFREDLTRSFGPRFSLSAGLDGLLSYDLADYALPIPPAARTLGTTTPPEVPIRRRLFDTAPAVYVEAQWAATPRLRVVPGARLDYYYVVGSNKLSFDPRLSARYTLTPRVTLKGTVGVYHQLPPGVFLDREFGNPNLALIWADQYELGAETQLMRALNLTTTAFYVQRHDLPVTSVDHFSSLGRGRAYGLEVLLKREVTEHFYGWIAYTLSRSEEAGDRAGGIPGVVLAGPTNDTSQTWHPSQFDQTHNLVLLGSYKRGPWELGARFRLVTGVPTTPIVGSFYDVDFNGYTPIMGAPGSARLPTFRQLDARLERTWTFDYWVLGAYLDVQNVLNAQNPETLIYDYRFRQSAPVRGLPILPLAGVRGRF